RPTTGSWRLRAPPSTGCDIGANRDSLRPKGRGGVPTASIPAVLVPIGCRFPNAGDREITSGSIVNLTRSWRNDLPTDQRISESIPGHREPIVIRPPGPSPRLLRHGP